jgi:AraC-like DNA-binding protein
MTLGRDHHVSDEPLHRYQVVNTKDPSVFRKVLHETYGATNLEIADLGAFHARGNFVQLQLIALGYSACGAPATIDFPATEYARMQIALKGTAFTRIGDQTVEINERQACIASPGQPTRLSFREGYEQFILRINSKCLIEKVSLIIGAKPRGKLIFEPVARFDTPSAKSLYQLVRFVAEQVNSAEAVLPSIILRELEQAIAISFLYASKHSFSSYLVQDGKRAAPQQVKQVEEYIEAHWNEPLQIATLAELTGHSARSVFGAFRQHRGYSPMAFAKRVRLRHAHEMLSSNCAKHTVTGTAFACGFANLGHFARDYREMFHERPSETLARARSKPG